MNQRGFSRIGLLALITVILGVISVYYMYISLGRRASLNTDNRTTDTQTPPLLAIPSLAGTVKSLAGDVLVITAETNNNTQDHTVTLTSSTKITRKPNVIPRQFTKEVPVPVSAERSDIQKGQWVEVMVDKRDFSLAMEIILPRTTYVLQGTIVARKDSSLTVNAAPVLEMVPVNNGSPLLPSQERYIVTVTDHTEISHEAKQYRIVDLKEGQPVTIYAESDVTNSRNVTAAMVEPII